MKEEKEEGGKGEGSTKNERNRIEEDGRGRARRETRDDV
jgi:hypothetical protein